MPFPEKNSDTGLRHGRSVKCALEIISNISKPPVGILVLPPDRLLFSLVLQQARTDQIQEDQAHGPRDFRLWENPDRDWKKH